MNDFSISLIKKKIKLATSRRLTPLDVLISVQNVLLPYESNQSWELNQKAIKNLLHIATDLTNDTDTQSLLGLAYVNGIISNLSADFSYNKKGKVYGKSYERPSTISLMKKINEILIKQLQETNNFIYEMGYPYQSLETCGVFGARDSFQRIIDYQICSYIKQNERVLDIGANSGFIGILSSQLTRCHVTHCDHNQYFLEIGRVVAEHLGVSDLNTFMHDNANKLDKNKLGAFDHIFSFASHFTDDAGLRNSYVEHFSLMKSLLSVDGKIFFESHCADAQSKELDQFVNDGIKQFNMKATLDKMLDGDTRRLIIFESYS